MATKAADKLLPEMITPPRTAAEDRRRQPLRLPALRRYLWPAALLGAVSLVLAVNMSRGSGGSGGQPVRLAPVSLGPLSVDVQATGAIEPEERIELRYPHEPAEVAEVLVEPGDRVYRGQPLVRLEEGPLVERARREQSAYLEASKRLLDVVNGRRETELAQRELALERAQRDLAFQQERVEQLGELQEAGLVSKMDLAQASHELESTRLAVRENELELEAFKNALGGEERASLEAEVDYRRLAAERAQAALEERVLSAPADGTVLEVGVHPGELLSRGQLAVALADMHRFEVSLQVDELEVRRMEPGQKVFLRSEYFGAEELEGTIRRVVPTVETHRGVPSVELRVEVPVSRWEPPMGLSIDARIHIDQAEAVVTVPLEAIVERQGKNVVFLEEKGRARQQRVLLGLRNENRVEITEGLEPGQDVIVGGHVFLEDGDEVRAVDSANNGSLRVEFFQ